MGLIDAIREGRYVPGEMSPPAVRDVTTLAATASRIVVEADVMPAVRDFLDEASRMTDAQLREAIAGRPDPTGDSFADALVAGVAEHLAASRRVRTPAWVDEPGRFLDRFRFVSEIPGFRAVALAQTPIALKRRGVLWPERSMRRV
jgi:hypothetical protein